MKLNTNSNSYIIICLRLSGAEADAGRQRGPRREETDSLFAQHP